MSQQSNEPIIIIGYSGHSYVVIDALLSKKLEILGYCDVNNKTENPFNLNYLGSENELLLRDQSWFVGIGDNVIRGKIINKFKSIGNLVSIFHRSSTISPLSDIGKGTFVSAQGIINPCSKIGVGCIVNSGAIVEHECRISDFVHIAPGAVLAGNVSVGEASFIGANSVIKQGVSIGQNVTIGAGSVIIKDIPDNVTVVGNPGKIIKIKS